MDQIKKPTFTAQESQQILKLQQLFHNHFLTPELLNQLISLYVRAVQQFNKEYLFMRAYYLDKMQFVLNQPQITKMLQTTGDGKLAAETIRQTVKIPQRFTDRQEERNYYGYKQENNVRQHAPNYYYDQSKTKERNFKINMQMKLMKQVQQNMKNISKEVQNADKKLQEKQIMIEDITKNQNNKLQERLMKRKKRLRKKSLVIQSKKQDQDQQEKPVIKVQQLKQAQRQLTNAVQRYTIRLTQRNSIQIKDKAQIKARIKMLKIQEQEDEPKQNNQQPVQQGRIKTRRVDEQDQSQYW